MNPSRVTWSITGRNYSFEPHSAPWLMGILNVTPDSFSDGGQFLAPDRAAEHALQLARDGADIIDVGGQSTRPGSEPVALDEELRRVIPAIDAIRRRSDTLISVDTSKAEVARQAIAAGAQIVNDVSALRDDPAMVQVVGDSSAAVILMHMRGTPKTMQDAPHYDDVTADVRGFLAERIAWLSAQGVDPARIAIDPGIGFGKSAEHNLQLVRDLASLASLGRPVCLGHSRKRFIGKILNRPADERLIGTVAVAIAGYQRGAKIIRVHDVAAVRDAIAMIRAIDRVPGCVAASYNTIDET